MCACTPMITPRDGDVDTGTHTHVGIGKKKREPQPCGQPCGQPVLRKPRLTKCTVARTLTAAHLSALNRKMLDSE